MSNLIIWSPEAEKDMEVILYYLQKNWTNPVVSNFIDKVEENLTLLEQEPKLFPFANEQLKIRKCVVTEHNTLYYREKNQAIEIIRLFDSRQDPKKLKFI